MQMRKFSIALDSVKIFTPTFPLCKLRMEFQLKALSFTLA